MGNDKTLILRYFTWIILLWCGYIVGSAIWQNSFTLMDTDSYTRLIRVERWVTNGLWSNNSLIHFNAPYGALHFAWTKLVDFTLLITALPLLPFTSFHHALYWGSLVNGPLFLWASMLALAWGVWEQGGKWAALLAGSMLLANPLIQNYANPFHVDHHMAQVFGLCIAIALVLRRRFMPLLGIVCALGVWVSVEFFVAVAWALGVLWWQWLTDKENKGDDLKHVGLFFFISSAIILPIERGSDTLNLYDAERLSVLFVLIIGLHCLVAQIVTQWGQQHRWGSLLTASGVACAILVGWIHTTGLLEHGAFGLTQFYGHITTDSISEIVPMFSNGVVNTNNSLFYILNVVSLWAWWRVQQSKRYPTLLRDVTIGLVPLTFAMFFVMLRSGIYLAPFISVIFGLYATVMRSENGKNQQPSGRDMLIFLTHVAVWSSLFVWVYPRAYAWLHNKPLAETPTKEEPTDNKPFYLLDYKGKESPLMDFLRKEPSCIIWALDDLDAAALPWYSHHRVVSAPYNSIPEALSDYRTLVNTTNQAEAAALCYKRGVKQILVRTQDITRKDLPQKAGTLGAYFANNTYPDWLEPVSLPENVDSRYKLFNIVEPSGASARLNVIMP